MSEINFDGLVGPTHNYAGLAYGNVASITHAKQISNPRLAAKQGLQKMRLLMDLGVPQAVIPPQLRPNFALLRELGFSGKPEQMLQQANKINPALLATVYSASSMWTANMATVSPSCDTQDQTVHFTPANMTMNLHRAQEAAFNYKLLQRIFSDPKHFTVHQPLPAFRDLSDEGAANHSLLCTDYNMPGVEIFVYGRHGLDAYRHVTGKYPARQTQLASTANMLNHKLDQTKTMLLQQSPEAIDAGAFHNDVVFVANKNVIFCHQQAIAGWDEASAAINKFFANDCHIIEVSAKQLSLEEAIATYLFNSQLVSLTNGDMALIAPYECKESDAAMNVINAVLADKNPIKHVEFVQCRQSMHNGGGPACLRLRVVLTPRQQAACLQSVLLTDDLYKKLDQWIDKHYREQLAASDFLDPQLIVEVQTALDELSKILQLGNIYSEL
ncbi:MAG TPA: N-succinylarginine dihydrolase [Gammaproteobacteria bacterium]|nr:N-succinylarginine dihydrolase [Gammaproteobacteria bacterium]